MLQHRLLRNSARFLRNTTPRTSLFAPIRRKIAGKVKAKDIKADDPVVDPFRAYKDPKYYSFLMNEVPKHPLQEATDVYLYMKEGKWTFFDLFFASCIGIWAMWKIGYQPWMLENFTWNSKQWKDGNYHTAFTSFASHTSVFHIAANLLIGERCVRLMRGLCNFNVYFGIFLGAGLIANYAILYRQNHEVSRMGCSAGVCAMLMAAMVYQPWRMMEVWIPFFGNFHKQFLWRLIVLFGGFDLLLCAYKDSSYGHDAHTVGYAVGLVGGLLMKRYSTGVPINHLWRKPVLPMKKKPPLWDTKSWDRLAQEGRRSGYGGM